jgi:hypothetical protein
MTPMSIRLSPEIGRPTPGRRKRTEVIPKTYGGGSCYVEICRVEDAYTTMRGEEWK